MTVDLIIAVYIYSLVMISIEKSMGLWQISSTNFMVRDKLKTL